MPVAPVVPYVDEIPTWIEMTSAFVGGLAGALTALRCRFDLSGILMLSIVTGLGGGMLRDTLLQQGPPVALTSAWLLPSALAAGALVFFFSETINTAHRHGEGLLVLVDAVFVAVFATVGTAKGLGVGLPSVSCVLLGVLAGFGGGLLRDILVNEQPELLRPGGLAGLAALIGCSLQVFLVRELGAPNSIGVGPMVVIIGIRLLAIWRGWESPMPTDMVQQVQKIKIPKRRRSRHRPPRP